MSPMIRKIGNTSVPAIGFGAMGLSVGYGTIGSDEERFEVLDAAHAQGCTHWDTAYQYGDSEELIGKWFKRTGKRNDIFLATKGGIDPTSAPTGTPESINDHFATSLQRLGVDTIDLYYLHRADSKIPIEVSVGALAKLVQSGRVKYIGLSECSARTLRRAHAVHPISVIQVEFSPFGMDITDPKIGLLTTARELGVKIVAYAPLGRGFLTGQYKSLNDLEITDFRRYLPRFSEANWPKILNIVSRIKEISAAKNITPGQVTLAWILAQGDDFFVIPGTKKVKYLIENAVAASVRLTLEEIAAVQSVVDEGELPGDRYPPGMLEYTFADTVELE